MLLILLGEDEDDTVHVVGMSCTHHAKRQPVVRFGGGIIHMASSHKRVDFCICISYISLKRSVLSSKY